MEVVRKLAMPTSPPTRGASFSVWRGTSSSNERVSHQHPLRLHSVVEVLSFFSLRACLWYAASLTGTRKGWPLSRVEIRSQYSKVESSDGSMTTTLALAWMEGTRSSGTFHSRQTGSVLLGLMGIPLLSARSAASA